MANNSPRRRKVTLASSLMQAQIRKVSESRGFAQTRVLTHWPEIAGEEMAAISRPVDVSYARNGMGATLTLLTTGANAPLLEMQKEKLRERVNAIYGYNAIARIRVTQTAATGFSEGRVSFQHRAPKEPLAPVPDEATRAKAQAAAMGVTNDDLRAALERLATNVLSRTQQQG